MIKKRFLLTLALLPFLLPSHTYSYDLELTESPTVTAVVTSSTTEGDTIPPTIPILIRPTDTAIISDPYIEYVWRASTDPNGNTVTYKLTLNNQVLFTDIIDIDNSGTYGYVTRLDGDEIHLRPSSRLPDGIYNWSITAVDTSGNESVSAHWSFTVKNTPPILTILDIGSYQDLGWSTDDQSSLPPGTILTLPYSPQIAFRLDSQVGVTTSLKIYPHSFSAYHQTEIINLYTHLASGTYTVIASATDLAGNAVALPEFTLIISDPIPTLTSTVPTFIRPIVQSLVGLPATASYIATRSTSLPLYIVSSVIVLLIYIIIVLRRRDNLRLLDGYSDQPLYNLTVQKIPHAPNTSEIKSASRYSQLFGNRLRYLDLTNSRGYAFLSHLSPHDTILVTTKEGMTLHFCPLKVEYPVTTISVF